MLSLGGGISTDAIRRYLLNEETPGIRGISGENQAIPDVSGAYGPEDCTE